MSKSSFFVEFYHICGMQRHQKLILSATIAILLFLFWYKGFPYMLTFQEQNQLFLFNWDYLLQSLSVSGGLADYIAEFVTQFFLFPWAGAILLAILLIALQLLSFRLFKGKDWYCLSFLPSAAMLVMMGDHDIMLCYLVGMILALALSLAYRRFPSVYFAILAIPAAFWLIGPAAWLFVLYLIIYNRKWQSLLYIPYSFALLYLASRTVLCQYPWRQILLGLDYFRMPMMQPTLFLLPLASAALAMLLGNLLPSPKRKLAAEIATMLAICIASGLGIARSYDRTGAYQVISYDQMVRFEKWEDIIEMSKKYQPNSQLSSVCVNMSLCITGQMDKFSQFNQYGVQGLVMPRVRDNISNSATSEVFWRLGLINESLRYAFDTQESIPNLRKSGRWMSRMAECQILNGRPQVASKYLDILGESLFYRKWARQKKELLENPALIMQDPVYSYLLSVRLDEDFLFYYPEFGKILYKMYLENKNNYMAAWYLQVWMEMVKNSNANETISDYSVHGS